MEGLTGCVFFSANMGAGFSIVVDTTRLFV